MLNISLRIWKLLTYCSWSKVPTTQSNQSWFLPTIKMWPIYPKMRWKALAWIIIISVLFHALLVVYFHFGNQILVLACGLFQVLSQCKHRYQLSVTFKSRFKQMVKSLNTVLMTAWPRSRWPYGATTSKENQIKNLWSVGDHKLKTETDLGLYVSDSPRWCNINGTFFDKLYLWVL